MTRKLPASSVDRALAVKYLTKASRFKTDAENMAHSDDRRQSRDSRLSGHSEPEG